MIDLEKLLAEVTPGEWCVADETVVWTKINDPIETTYDIGYPIAEARTQKSFWNGTRWPDGQPEANARLIAMAPALARKVIAAEKLADALRITRDRLSDACHSEFDGVWTAEDFERETCEADEALAEWEALK